MQKTLTEKVSHGCGNEVSDFSETDHEVRVGVAEGVQYCGVTLTQQILFNMSSMVLMIHNVRWSVDLKTLYFSLLTIYIYSCLPAL